MTVEMAIICKQADVDSTEHPRDSSITCAFNPENLRVSFSKPQPPQPSSNSGGTDHAAVEANNVRLDVTLFFDTTETGDDVRTGPEDANGTRILKTLAGPVDGAPAPSVAFTWGTFRFSGAIETLTETLDFWSAEGIPLRSSVQLSIAGNHLDEVTDGTINFAQVSPPTNGWGTTDIATLGGNSAAGRDIARENEVENPRFPALDNAAKAIETVNDAIDSAFDDVNENIDEANAAVGELNEALDKLSIGSDKSIGGTSGSGRGGGAGLSLGLSADVGIKASAGFKLGFSAGASVGFGFGASAGGGASFGIGADISFGIGLSADLGLDVGLGGSLDGSFDLSLGAQASAAGNVGASANVSASIGANGAQAGMTGQTGYSGSAAATLLAAASSSAALDIAPPLAVGSASSPLTGQIQTASITAFAASSSGVSASAATRSAGIVGATLTPTPADSNRALASLPASLGAFAGLSQRQERLARLDIAAIASAPITPTAGPNTQFDVLGRASGGNSDGWAIARSPRNVSAARAVRMS